MTTHPHHLGTLWPPDVARTTQLTPEALTELRRHARGFLLVQEATCVARVVEAREALGRAKPADRVAASARVAQAEQQHAFALEQLQDLVALEPQHHHAVSART